MQAVLLAAGESSRMYPFSENGHKSMVKIMGKPLIQYVIEKLRERNILEIVIVVNSDQIENYFGNGSDFGVKINYVFQEHASGMGQALLLSSKFIKDDFILLNAYHLDFDSNFNQIFELKKNSDGVLILNKRDETWRYGVAEIKDNQIIGINEKPEKGKEKSNLCVVGIYALSKDFISVLEKVPENHYNFEDALDKFAKNKNISFVITEKNIAFKYPWDLLGIKNYLLSYISRNKGKNLKIGKNVVLEGEIYFGDNVTILDGACIKGPSFLGDNSYIGSNALLRNGVVLEENSSIGSFSEVKNSLIMKNSKTHSGFIGDSIIGENVKIGGRVTTTNVRLDRKNVRVLVKNEKVDTGMRHFGAIIGSRVNIGGNVTIMPGIVIGNDSVIGPSTTVVDNVESNTKYYTEFKEIIIKK